MHAAVYPLRARTTSLTDPPLLRYARVSAECRNRSFNSFVINACARTCVCVCVRVRAGVVEVIARTATAKTNIMDTNGRANDGV